MSKQTVVMRKHVSFPVDLVFEAWTAKHEVEQWLSCGSSGKLSKVESWSGVVGDPISVWIRDPVYGDIEITGKFIKVEHPTHLSYSWGPFEDIVTVRFQETDTGTQIVVEQTLDDSSPMTCTVRDGWTQNLDDVDRHLDLLLLQRQNVPRI